MRYYRIDHSILKVGNYPQVQSAVHPVSVDDPRHIGNIWGEAKGKVAVPQGLLAKRAKVLDLLSGSSIGFSVKLLVSERFAELIRVSNYYGVQFFSTEVITPTGDELPYEIIHPYNYPYEIINAQRTDFFFREKSESEPFRINISESPELRVRYQELVWPQQIIIDNISFESTADLDFFPVRFLEQGGIGWFMSELLKKECEKIPITGITYEPV